MNEDEIFAIVDEEGKVIGKSTRSECHSGSKLLHAVIHLHIFDSNGDLFLQKRSATKDIQPNRWDSSVGGHIDWNENPEQAVVREAKEELGIELHDISFITKYIIETEQEKELTYCYYTVYDGDYKIDEDEVSDGRKWMIQEIKNNLNKNIFTYNFEQDFQRFLSNGISDLTRVRL